MLSLVDKCYRFNIKTDLHDALDGFEIKAVIDDLTLGSLWMVGNNRKIVSVVDKDLKGGSSLPLSMSQTISET